MAETLVASAEATECPPRELISLHPTQMNRRLFGDRGPVSATIRPGGRTDMRFDERDVLRGLSTREGVSD